MIRSNRQAFAELLRKQSEQPLEPLIRSPPPPPDPEPKEPTQVPPHPPHMFHNEALERNVIDFLNPFGRRLREILGMAAEDGEGGGGSTGENLWLEMVEASL